jgi:two-component system sensor histidine kinase KdpD
LSAKAEHRPDPDQLLKHLEAEQAQIHRAKLKVFLGYASGVGKSERMLDEGRRRKERGEDVVIGALQSKTDPSLQRLVDLFEVIPTIGEALNLPAILKRRPKVCMVDGLAQGTRYLEVQQLLEAGISIITAVNIQFIEELRAKVEPITGKRVRETVPKSFILSADEIEVVDMAAEQLLERIGRAPDEHAAAAERRRLSELREIALVLSAEVVDHQLARFLKEHGIEQQFATQERVVVCLTPRANFRIMVDVGARIAQRFYGELYVIYVQQASASAKDKEVLDQQIAYAENAGARVEVLASDDPMDAILRFAREKSITQVFIGHSLRQSWWSRLFGTPVDRLIRNAEGIDVCIFPH